MPNTQYCEIVKFNLKAGITDDQFLAAEKAIRATIINEQKGYQGRDVYQDADGAWLVIIRWDNKECANAWSPIFMSLPEGKAFGGLMDFATARQEHYTLANV